MMLPSQRTIVQIIALSVVLLVVTDYMEQSWLFQRITMNSAVNNNDNNNHRFLEEAAASTNTAAVTAATTVTKQSSHLRALQQQSQQQQQQRQLQEGEEHVCGTNEIKNSHMELGSTVYWNAINSDISLTTPGYGTVNEYALVAANRTSWFAGMYQPLITDENKTCFQVGDSMEITFQVKLLNPDPSVDVVVCDPTVANNHDGCPMVILGTNYQDDSYYHERIYDDDMVWNTNDAAEWNTFQVIHIMTSQNVVASSLPSNATNTVKDLYVMFVGGQGDLVIDNVLIRYLPCHGNIVPNSGAEEGTTEIASLTSASSWQEVGYPPGQGYFSVSTVEPFEGNYSFVHTNRSSLVGRETNAEYSHVGQYILLRDSDSSDSCMTVGSTWRVSAKFRLWAPTSSNTTGTNSTIETTNRRSSFDNCTQPPPGRLFGNCPVMLYTIMGGDAYATGNGNNYHTWNDPNMLENWDPYGWNTFEIQVVMDETMAGAQDGFYEPRLYILTGNSNDDLYVDDIQMERLTVEESPTSSPTISLSPTQAPTDYCSQNYGAYQNFDYTFDDESILWDRVNDEHNVVGPWSAFGGKLGVETPGYGNAGHAMRAYGRTSWATGPFFWHVDVANCVHGPSRSTATWRFSAKVKLYYESTGLPVTTCTPSTRSLDCPVVRLLLKYNAPERYSWLTLHDTSMVWPTDGSWTDMELFFSLPEENYAPDLEIMAPMLVGGPSGSVALWDNVVFQQLPGDFTPTATPTQTVSPSSSPTVYCTKNMFQNADLAQGTSTHWWPWNSQMTVLNDSNNEYEYALQASSRGHSHSGVAQRVDPACLQAGTTWLISFTVKLLQPETGLPYTDCDPTLSSGQYCPFVNILYHKAGDDQLHNKEIYDTAMEWKQSSSNNEWNKFHVIWKPDDDLFWPARGYEPLSYVIVAVVGGPANTTLVVDNLQFEQLERWEIPTQSPSQSPMPSVAPTNYCDRYNHFDNGDGETYATSSNPTNPWLPFGTNNVGLAAGTGYSNTSNNSIRAYDRASWHRGVGQWMDPVCVTQNSTWHLSAMVKLVDQETGQPITTSQCNPKNTMSNYCPMLRVFTSKPTNTTSTTSSSSNTGGRRRRRKLVQDEENVFQADLYRDTNMVWNDDGDWVELNIYIQLNPSNSGPDVNSIVPFLVGGPPNSVLYIDDVRMQRTSADGSSSTAEYAATTTSASSVVQTCSSTGDPHLESHYGELFDNHGVGWTTLFDANGVRVETEQVGLVGLDSVRFNRAWRITQQGIVTAQGQSGGTTAGSILTAEEGVYFITDPITVWIHIQAVDLSLSSTFQDWMYNVYVTTSQYEDDVGLCSKGKPDDAAATESTTSTTILMEDQSPLAVTNPDPAVVAAAEEACSSLNTTSGFASVYQGCVKDILILQPIIENITTVTVMYTEDIAPLRKTIEETARAVESPEDGSTEEDELATVSQVKATTDSLTVDAATMREAALDGTTTTTTAGVEGDPVIMGLMDQTFDFPGETDKWYANFASQQLQWNVKFHHFDSCVGEDGMYITSMAYDIQRSSPTETDNNHQVLVSIIDESQVFPGCPDGQVCLSDGSLQLIIDGETWTQPGDYRVSDDLRIVAFNTYDACARKWYDYEEGHRRHDGIYNNAAVHRRTVRRTRRQVRRVLQRLQQQQQESADTTNTHNNNNNKKKRSFMDYVLPFRNNNNNNQGMNHQQRQRRRKTGDISTTTRSLLSMSQSPLDIIRKNREHMLRPNDCSAWLEHRTKNDDLFTQTGGWAMIYIETPHARFQLQHRQVRKPREVLEGGGSGSHEDIVVEGVLFEGNKHLCQAHVMDGWLEQTSASLREERRWNGILGETKELKRHDNGAPILENRDLILIGPDDSDYEVVEPFGKDFLAKHMNEQIRSLWDEDEQQQQQPRRSTTSPNKNSAAAAGVRDDAADAPPPARMPLNNDMFDYTTSTFTKEEKSKGVIAARTLQSLWNCVQSFFEIIISALFRGVITLF